MRVVYQEINLVLPTAKALAKAQELGLDLVEIAPNADPPVCKIVDYGKYKYELAKQQKDRPKVKSKVKELKFRVRIDPHDYSIKLARAENFLDHGDKLRIQLQFRGRENAHRELGFELMNRVKDDLLTMAKVDAAPKLNGRQIVMMLSPLPEKQRQRKFSKVEIPDDYVDQDDLAHDEDDDHDHDLDSPEMSAADAHDEDSAHEEEE